MNVKDPYAHPETVRVKFDCEQGFMIINKDDFVEGTHELFEGDVPAAEESATATVDQTKLEKDLHDGLQGSVVKPSWQSQ